MDMLSEKNEKEQISGEYIELYGELYNSIKLHGMRWLTVSPPRNDDDPNDYLSDWLDEFESFIHFSKKFIIVVEFAQLRMHFHMVYSVTDKIKEYKMVNRWAKTSQTRVYSGEPKGGIEYLFKDIAEAKDLLKDDPVYVIEDLKERRLIRKKKRQEEIRLRRDKYKREVIEIPMCFRQDYSDDEASSNTI